MQIKNVLKRPSFWHKLALTSVFIFLWAVCFVRQDPDMGWHLRSGYDILTGGIPKNDLYTYTMPNFRWINHEWLSDVLMNTLHHFGGNILLSLSFAGLWFGSLLLATRKYSWQIIFLACIGLSPYLGIRPVVWTFLGIVVLERIVEHYRTTRNKRFLGGIVFLFILWANLHGGFAIGLAILGVYSLLYKNRLLLLTTAASVGATLLNPYGWRVYQEIFRTMLDSQLKHTINEWHPLYSRGLSLRFTVLMPTIFIVISLALLLSQKQKLKHYIQNYCVPLLTFLAALFSTRHIPLFVATVSRHTEQQLRSLQNRLSKNVKLFFETLFSSLIVMVFIYCGWVIALKPVLDGGNDVNIGSTINEQCQGNIFNSYDLGGYLIYTAPNVKVYIDGRMPSWGDEEGRIFDRYTKMLSDADYRQQEFEKHNISCVAVKATNNRIISWLKDNNWKEAARSDVYVLYTKPK